MEINRQRKYQLAKIAKGLCAYCSEPIAPNSKTRCKKHAAKQLKTARETRARAKTVKMIDMRDLIWVEKFLSGVEPGLLGKLAKADIGLVTLLQWLRGMQLQRQPGEYFHCYECSHVTNSPTEGHDQTCMLAKLMRLYHEEQ